MIDIKLLKEILQSIHTKFSDIIKQTLKKDISEVAEQTVLASSSFEIISIANGTKSVGKKHMSTTGNLIHDSHAEVLARRAFKKFVLDNLQNPKYFQKNDQDKYVKNFKVLFYTSQTPCGQASMIESLNKKEIPSELNEMQSAQSNNTVQSQNISSGDNEIQQNETIIEQQKLFQNTGAKYYSFLQDEKYIVEKDQQSNILRIKPGRSDLPQDARSLSLSCSDKIMLWNIVGLQGSLLANFIEEPIYINYFFVESDGKDTQKFKQIVQSGIDITYRLKDKYSKKQLEQKVLKWRNKPISKSYTYKKAPIIVTKKYFFKLNRSLSSTKPKYLDQHIVYLKSYMSNNGEVREDFVEILNGNTGMKWGMGEKGAKIAKNYPALCKYNLFKAYSEVKHMSSSQCYLKNKQQAIRHNLIKSQALKLFNENIANKISYNDFSFTNE